MVEAYYVNAPDGLLNEVRCFLGHIVDAQLHTSDSFNDRISNIDAAHTHLRRILLDCYKLLIIYYQDYINAFNQKFRWVDLSDVKDGTFINEFDNLKKIALDSFLEAKKYDRIGKNHKETEKDDVVYQKFQDAFNNYCDVKTYIDNNYKGINRVKHRSIKRKILAVGGWIVGIGVSIAFGLYGVLN